MMRGTAHDPRTPFQTKASPRTRKNSYRIGVNAEGLARQLLEEKNYRILAQRYRNKAGEIDLIAVRDNHLAFVEVKGRKSQEEAAWSVLPRQQMRITQAAEGFLAEHAELAMCSASFDVVLVSPSEGCSHIEQAFFAGE